MVNLQTFVRKYSLLILSILGIVISIYLLIVHYSNIPIACPKTNFVNCDLVLKSSYAVLFGIPMPFYGIFFFLVALFFLNRIKILIWWLSIGILFVFYLLYTELFRLHVICLWCTSVHIIVFIMFFISLIFHLFDP